MERLGGEELTRVRRLGAEFSRAGIIPLVSRSTPEVGTAPADGLVPAVLEETVNSAFSRKAMG